MSSLHKKLAIVILAGISSAIFSFAMPVATAATAPDWCNVDDPTELSTKIEENTEKATKEDLEGCLEKVNKKTDEANNTGDIKTIADFSQASKDLSDAILSKQADTPIDAYVKSAQVGVTDISAEEHKCITKADANNIIAVVEEPLETELTNTDQTKVRTCTRNTFCVRRKEKGEQECITYLNAKSLGGDKYEPFCSTDASDYMKDHPGDASLYCQPVQVYLSSTGTYLLFVYISTIYKWAASVIGIIAVLVIVISGIQISAAAGDQQGVTNAKNRIFQSLGGLALLFLSAIILYTINPNFFTAG